MSSRKVRYYDSSTQTTTTAKFSFNKGKRYKWNKSSGAVEEITDTNTLADDELTIAGSKSSLRRISDIERNVSILASKVGVVGSTNDDTDAVLKSGSTMDGDLRIDKSDAAIILNDSKGSPEDQSIKIRAESLDNQLPGGEGLGIIIEENSSNGSPDTTPALVVKGQIYAGSAANKVWHAGNLDTTSFLSSNANDTYTGLLQFGSTSTRIDGSDTFPLVQVNSSRAYFGSTSRNKTVIASADTIHHVRAGTEYTIWTAYNDGSGSGLDADLLDGVDSTSFLRSDAADTSTGKIDFQGSIVVSNPVGTGHLQMGNVDNHSGNGYLRNNIVFQRNQDQITYDSTISSWTHAGGSSTDWSMIAHSSGALEFYSGPSSASAVTYTHADFETNFKWLSTNHVTGAAGRSVNLYGGLSVSNSLSVTGNVNAASVYSSDEVKVTFNSTDGTTAVKGYGIEMSRASSYLRPTADGTQTLFIGGADASLDWNTVQIKSTNGIKLNDEFLDNRYLMKNGTENGAVTIPVTNTDFIVQDTADGTTNFIWRDHSANVLYLGTANAVATLRSTLNLNSNNITNGNTITANYGRFESSGDASATSTTHAFQAGPTSSQNIIIDNNEIIARSNGALAPLYLQTDGQSTVFGNNTVNKVTVLNGNIDATGDICAYSTSDVSFKENVAPISNPLDKVMAIRGVEFDWNDDYVNTRGGVDGYFTRKHDVGVIAQEVEAVMPEVVGTKQDGTKGVRYEKMVGLLIEAIKDQQQQIEELKSKLEG